MHTKRLEKYMWVDERFRAFIQRTLYPRNNTRDRGTPKLHNLMLARENPPGTS